MIKQNGFNLFTIIFIALIGSINAFHSQALAQSGELNFIYKYTLQDNDYSYYPSVLKKTFTDLFNLDMVVQDDIPRMLTFLATAESEHFSTRFESHEEVEVSALSESLEMIFLSEEANIRKAFSKLKPIDKSLVSEMTNDLTLFFKDYVIYILKLAFEFEELGEPEKPFKNHPSHEYTRLESNSSDFNNRLSLISSNEINETSQSSSDAFMKQTKFPEKAVLDAISKFIKSSELVRTVVNQEEFTKYVNEIITNQIDNKLHGYVQYLNFRKEGANGLFNAANVILTSIRNNETTLDSSSLEKFFDLLSATVYLNEKYNMENIHMHVEVFMKSFFEMNNIESTFQFNLITNLFAIFSVNPTDVSYRVGTGLLVLYLFPEHVNNSFHRESLLIDIYGKRKMTLDFNLKKYYNFKNAELFFIADLLRTTNQGDFRLDDKDFIALMKGFPILGKHSFKKYDLFDSMDHLFNTSESNLNENIEIYTALYNSIIIWITEWKLNEPVIDDQIINSYESFLTLTKSKETEIEEFPFNIKEYYLVFKLLNFALNQEYFKRHNDMFLRFDAEFEPQTIAFMDNIPGLKTLLIKWKNSKGSKELTDIFNYEKLSGNTIDISFMLDETKDKNRETLLFI